MVGRPGAVSPVLAQDSQLPGTGGLARLSPFPQALMALVSPDVPSSVANQAPEGQLPSVREAPDLR